MLVAISAMHNRHALSRAWAEHTASLGFDVVAVAVTRGDADNIETCARHGFVYVEVDNAPLGAKFNAALEAGTYNGVTRAAILPSDDFASPAWVKAAREHEGDYLYPHTCGVVDSATQNAYRITKLTFTGTLRYGAGRVVSRKVIEKLGGELWPQLMNRGLDTASHQRIQKAGFQPTVVETEGIPITDVKTEENLWPFVTWESGSKRCTADEALHMCSPSVREQIDALKR